MSKLHFDEMNREKRQIISVYSHLKDQRLPRLSLRYFLCVLCAFVVTLGSLSGIIGCGKKGMPSPPRVDPVPAVSDLSHQIDGEQVILSWTVPGRIQEGDFGNGEMMISRARIKLEDEPCTDCPLVFQRIARVPIPAVDVESDFTYTDRIEHGFRYTYRVVLKMDKGRTSSPSNLVSFAY